MMSVWFGKDSTSTKKISLAFKLNWKQEYLNYEFVRRAMTLIDGCIFNEDNSNIWSPVFGWGHSPYYLSDWCKCVILLYVMPKEEFRPNIVVCGLNCSQSLAELSLIKDTNVSLSNCTMHFASYGIEEIDMFCENSNEHITNYEEWGEQLMKFYYNSER